MRDFLQAAFRSGPCPHGEFHLVHESRHESLDTHDIVLTDALITIDAMGCQKDIARDIVAGGGDFAIAVKDNQPKLREAIETHFEKRLESDREDLKYRSFETGERGHGRLDERSYYLTKIPADFPLKKEWPWIKAIGYTVRITEHADGRVTDEVRYDMPVTKRKAQGSRTRHGPRCSGCG